jgi:hypothetical protein
MFIVESIYSIPAMFPSRRFFKSLVISIRNNVYIITSLAVSLCIERDYTFVSIRRRKKETKQLKLPYKVIYLHNNNLISFFLLYSIMECLGMSIRERGCYKTKRLNNFCVLFHFRELLLLLFQIDYLNPVDVV